MCGSVWSRRRAKCIQEGTRHGGGVESVGVAAWLSETGFSRARKGNTKEKWAAMASAGGRAFMKLYRKLRCRACTANLGVEEPRASERRSSSQLSVWPRPFVGSDGRRRGGRLPGHVPVFGFGTVAAGCARHEDCTARNAPGQVVLRAVGTDLGHGPGHRRGSGEVRHYWDAIGDDQRELPPTSCRCSHSTLSLIA
jgi:hypothetical protein